VDVAIAGDRVVAVGGALREPAAEVIDCSRQAVIPGLINAHYHSNGNFDRGRWDNLPLEVFALFSFPKLLSPHLTARELYVRTAIGAIELLRSGVTCVVDFLFDPDGFGVPTLEPVIQAYRDVGLRVVIALGMSDRPYDETILVGRDAFEPELKQIIERERPPSWNAWETIVRDVVAKFDRPDAGVSIGVAPGAPERCTEEFLNGCARLADELDLVIHTHALESRMQALLAERAHGVTLIEYLGRIGFLGSRVSLQHGIWLTEHDIELVADAGATIVHNPMSNLKLGSGLCPVPSLLEHGVNVALGSDAASCNDGSDMFQTLKLAAVLHKIWDVDFGRWVGAEHAWQMATRGGALSAGQPDLGRVSPGARADLLLLDLESRGFTPLNDPLRQIVLAPTAEMLDSVMIGGRWVMRGGAVLGVHEEAIEAEARAIAATVSGRSTEALALAERMSGVVADAWRDARASYTGPTRQMPVS
jgi:cytosine/adenosine deaminase-related metal-dependent hydrolase